MYLNYIKQERNFLNLFVECTFSRNVLLGERVTELKNRDIEREALSLTDIDNMLKKKTPSISDPGGYVGFRG